MPKVNRLVWLLGCWGVFQLVGIDWFLDGVCECRSGVYITAYSWFFSWVATVVKTIDFGCAKYQKPISQPTLISSIYHKPISVDFTCYCWLQPPDGWLFVNHYHPAPSITNQYQPLISMFLACSLPTTLFWTLVNPYQPLAIAACKRACRAPPATSTKEWYPSQV